MSEMFKKLCPYLISVSLPPICQSCCCYTPPTLPPTFFSCLATSYTFVYGLHVRHHDLCNVFALLCTGLHCTHFKTIKVKLSERGKEEKTKKRERRTIRFFSSSKSFVRLFNVYTKFFIFPKRNFFFFTSICHRNEKIHPKKC
jgi:hypothetical protein